MRDYLLLYINGKRYCISGAEAFCSLSEFLRHRLGLTGAKVVCGEGVCGACSVLIGQSTGEDTDALQYRAVNSCLSRLFSLDCCHVVTVEGITESSGVLSPVQEALVQNHGTQCGYCTPGVVVALTALCENRSAAAAEASTLRDALAGNLCRCTGYLPIVEAGLQLLGSANAAETLAGRYPAQPIREDFAQKEAQSVLLAGPAALPVLHARTQADALAFLAEHPHAAIVAGGTGAFLEDDPDGLPVLSVGAIRELGRIEARENTLVIGAAVTWAQLGKVAEKRFPELAQVVRRFGAPQIRNVGTIGGSVARPDPNGDWLPLLLIQEATVQIASLASNREIPFADYLKAGCAPGELVTGITIPLPRRAGERLQTYKVTRRRAFDRSVFCAAVAMEWDTEGVIATARIACGGVGPLPLRLRRTEAFLQSAPYTAVTLRAAGEIAAAEIAPISDAYAGAEYRKQLTARLLLRFFHEVPS